MCCLLVFQSSENTTHVAGKNLRLRFSSQKYFRSFQFLFPLPCPFFMSFSSFSFITGFHLHFFSHRWRRQRSFNPIRTQQSIQRGSKSIQTISNFQSIQPKSSPLDSFHRRRSQMLWYHLSQPKTLIAPPCQGPYHPPLLPVGSIIGFFKRGHHQDQG